MIWRWEETIGKNFVRWGGTVDDEMLQEKIEDDTEVEVKEKKGTIKWLIVVKKVKKEEDKVD